VVFWVMKSCSLVSGYQHFGVSYRLLLKDFYPEVEVMQDRNLGDIVDTILRNVGNHLQDHTTHNREDYNRYIVI
jgi:hypothetical protein